MLYHPFISQLYCTRRAVSFLKEVFEYCSNTTWRWRWKGCINQNCLFCLGNYHASKYLFQTFHVTGLLVFSNLVLLLSNFLFMLLASRKIILDKAVGGLFLIVKLWPLHCIYTNPWPLSFIFCVKMVKIDLLKSHWNRLILILSHLRQVRGSCQTPREGSEIPYESRMMIKSIKLWLKFEIILKHIWMDLI